MILQGWRDPMILQGWICGIQGYYKVRLDRFRDSTRLDWRDPVILQGWRDPMILQG